ncbi:uncharacterized protein NP_5018A [Natronomonas pharaonis DSM 2160]|uniref:Uncharacterized protein n=1 Tax=Natronomonas pharaonis (strain ATCC 35678 / DSM 2160 / CIP 103997 / JCM 8858 / NBRC 14720 / NCIMB 2260 / Gabara) TaxID=348780 RepID=A0A1U7EZ96_NATPD|nr:hypothetical protein [Natronomonas pharaonis]CAI50600.1 uncharacterized protein NP_5018A [Natronomonas pharaonis DSM 2160]
MKLHRRTALRLAGVGVGTAVAGCLDPETDNGETNGITTETMPLAVRTGRPAWDRDDAVGNVVVIDDDDRQQAVFGRYDDAVGEDRSDEFQSFLENIDYGDERLVVVESVGPNACHDRLEIADSRLDDGELVARADVIDTSEEETACAEVVTYPSALLRVTFEDDPADTAAVAVTNGWGETATVVGTADDPLGPTVADLTGHVRPDDDPEPVPPLDCDAEEVERHPQGVDEAEIEWGTVEADSDPALALRVDEPAYEYGETATIRLTNVADRFVDTGNRNKYNLQVSTDDGWQDVRVADADRPMGYTDEEIVHSPGDGFEWQVELTEEAIEEKSIHDLAVCPELPAGRYRFVFWGVIGGGVAVAFDLSR